MDIDIAPDPSNNAPDPNELYHPIIRKLRKTFIGNAGNDNDLFLYFVLFKLARAVPDNTFNIEFETIEALRMNDLRDLLNSGNYEKAAHEVLRRCIAGEILRCNALRSDHIWSIEKQNPAPALPAAFGGRE